LAYMQRKIADVARGIKLQHPAVTESDPILFFDSKIEWEWELLVYCIVKKKSNEYEMVKGSKKMKHKISTHLLLPIPQKEVELFKVMINLS